MPDLLDQLRGEHATISDLLDDLSGEAVRLISRGDADLARIGSILDYMLIFPATSHHPVEDLLQHRLRVRAPEAADAVGNLEVDHIALHRRLDRVKASYTCLLGPGAGARARQRFASDVRDYVRHERRHHSLEEMLLFPAAEMILRDADWRDIERAAAPAPVAEPGQAWTPWPAAAE